MTAPSPEPEPSPNALRPFLWPAILAIVLVVVGGLVATRLKPAHPAGSAITADTTCPAIRQTIQINLHANGFKPSQITAHLCDQIVFHNATLGLMEIGFGPHEHHLEYPGLSDAVIGPSGNTKLTLVTQGAFPFHDHLNDAFTGTLVILP